MQLQPLSTDYPWSYPFTEVIDVRSPSEFAMDHVPGAINLPVLDDRQRAEVGTLYQQQSPFVARKLGAALVSQNLAKHLKQYFLDKPKDYFPAIYCWRGGQRSNSMAMVLTQIGWRTGLLSGGYKTYRTYVRSQLDVIPKHFKFQILCGLTGTAKTDILRTLRQQGANVLDLEALAHHRGSLLGRGGNPPQPSQKAFESSLLKSLTPFQPNIPVWVEAESNKIGQVFIPNLLWQRLKESPCVEIQASLDSRVQYLQQNYPYFVQNLPELLVQLQPLKRRYGHAQFQQWGEWITQKDIPRLVRSLLEVHYDPTYRRSMAYQYPNPIRQIQVEDLSVTTIKQLAQDLMAQVFKTYRDSI